MKNLIYIRKKLFIQIFPKNNCFELEVADIMEAS